MNYDSLARSIFRVTKVLSFPDRLLSWAVKNIEPYGVDYILQRLGFTQARITIPKWIQRGCMDPLDRVLSELMYHNITSNKANRSSK